MGTGADRSVVSRKGRLTTPEMAHSPIAAGSGCTRAPSDVFLGIRLADASYNATLLLKITTVFRYPAGCSHRPIVTRWRIRSYPPGETKGAMQMEEIHLTLHFGDKIFTLVAS